MHPRLNRALPAPARLLALALVGALPSLSAAAPAPTGMVTIESDSQRADNRTGIVTANGNVRITYPDRGMVATSRQAQYFSKEGRLVLTGDVDVVDTQGQSIRAERMVYRLDDERLVAEPPAGQQVFSRLRLQTRPAAAPAPIVP
jgi:lipopolysaccharide export system protein LptA